MGGLCSGRWAWHNKKMAVEDCRKLTIYSLKPWLVGVDMAGHTTWSRGGEKVAAISWEITGRGIPETIRLIYTITDKGTGEKIDFDYPIPLTYTLTAWGARRYWFTCSLSVDGRRCGRRVGALYLPPGRRYFGCRHCYNLTYTSSQESGKWNGFYSHMADMMQDIYPGATAADMRYALDNDRGRKRPPGGGYFERQTQKILADLLEDYPDPYERYLTAGELCEQSGLTSESLAALESARLLVPDHGGKYRPKLAGWGRKLAYLLGEGWTLEELKAWARGRWSTSNPRAWPSPGKPSCPDNKVE